jgi:hypothetical protein
MLVHLKNPTAQEAVCGRFIQQDLPFLRKVLVKAGYAPLKPGERALFYFLTGQWEKYENLDFDQTFLKIEYEKASDTLRKRIAGIARRAGRVEWATAVVGERQRNQQQTMTDAECAAIYAVLSKGQKWQEMWRLAQTAPARWSARMLMRLKEAGWIPDQELDQQGFLTLQKLAERCYNEKIEAVNTKSLDYITSPAPLRDIAGYVMTISANGKMLASAKWEDSNVVSVLTLPQGRMAHTFHAPDRISCLALSPDTNLLAGASNNAITLWKFGKNTTPVRLTGHADTVLGLAFTPDSTILASVSKDYTVRLWDTWNGRALNILQGHTDYVSCLAISVDGSTLVSGSWNRELRIWNLPDGSIRQTFTSYDAISCIALSPDNRFLAIGSLGVAQLLSLADGSVLQTLRGVRAVTSVAFSPDSHVLAIGSRGLVHLWSLVDGETLHAFRTPESQIRSLAFTPDELTLTAASYDSIILWSSWQAQIRKLITGRTHSSDLQKIQNILQKCKVTPAQRKWLAFTAELIRWQRRFDIEVEEAPQQIPIGEFDIELGK